MLDRYLEEAERVRKVEDNRKAIHLAALSAALVTLAAPVVAGYASRKDDASLLDYDDLIGRTSRPAGRSRRRLGAVQA